MQILFTMFSWELFMHTYKIQEIICMCTGACGHGNDVLCNDRNILRAQMSRALKWEKNPSWVRFCVAQNRHPHRAALKPSSRKPYAAADPRSKSNPERAMRVAVVSLDRSRAVPGPRWGSGFIRILQPTGSAFWEEEPSLLVRLRCVLSLPQFFTPLPRAHPEPLSGVCWIFKGFRSWRQLLP